MARGKKAGSGKRQKRQKGKGEKKEKERSEGKRRRRKGNRAGRSGRVFGGAEREKGKREPDGKTAFLFFVAGVGEKEKRGPEREQPGGGKEKAEICAVA